MISRRNMLKTTAGLLLTLSGCTSGERVVEVLYAGSLQREMEEIIKPEFESEYGIKCLTEARTSLTIVRLVKEGYRNPDVVITADAGLIKEFLGPPLTKEYTIFATNSIVVGENGVHLDENVWFNQIGDGEFTAGMSDPRVDPLGYNTLIMLKLGERHYRRKFSEKILRKILVFGTEMDLMANLETRSIETAFIYRNMAVSHNIDHIELPPEINLGSIKYGDLYGSVQITEGDRKIKGRPILYGMAVLESGKNKVNGELFRDFILEKGLKILKRSGFGTEGMPVTERVA